MSLAVLKSRAQLDTEAPTCLDRGVFIKWFTRFINSRIARGGCQRK
ncbi:hypothetical protein [Francisella persica]|nr:hypothetical protein [Francisella persica]